MDSRTKCLCTSDTNTCQLGIIVYKFKLKLMASVSCIWLSSSYGSASSLRMSSLLLQHLSLSSAQRHFRCISYLTNLTWLPRTVSGANIQPRGPLRARRGFTGPPCFLASKQAACPVLVSLARSLASPSPARASAAGLIVYQRNQQSESAD